MSKLDPAVVASIEQPQTESLDAFMSFSRGLDERDRQHPDAARALFERALSYDPNFKLAQQELRFTPITRFTVAQVESQASAAAPSAAAAAAVMIASTTIGTGGTGSGGGSTTGGNGSATGSGGNTTGGGTTLAGGSGPPILSNPLPLAVVPPVPPGLACPPCPACIQVHR